MMQLRRSRKVLKHWPLDGDVVQTFLRRTARRSGRVMHEAKAPQWDAGGDGRVQAVTCGSVGVARRFVPTNGLCPPLATERFRATAS